MATRALAATVATLLLSTCGGGDGPASPGGGNVVEIRLTAANRFSPADVTIDPGTTVRWVNDISMLHSVTPNNPAQPGVWTSAQRATPGVVLTHTFTASGQVYSYHCEPHLAEGMVGVIRVQ